VKILISVLNYNNFKITCLCLDSIIKNVEEEYVLLLVDNNSTDNSYYLLKNKYKNIKCLLSAKNAGYAAGHKMSVNYGIENKFDLLWVLNNDLIIKKATLKELLSSHFQNGLGIYGSITLKSEDPDIINFAGGKIDDISKPLDYNAFEDCELGEYYKQEPNLRPVQSIEGSSFLIPFDIIKKHGFMREDFFMYGEETDYCFRLNKKGIKSYIVPKSIVVHKGAESLKKNRYLEKYYRRRNFLFFEKYHYGIPILKNISIKSGLISSIKYFFKFYIKFKTKDDLYYINLANFHALINKKGKLK